MSYETFETALKNRCVSLFGDTRKFGTQLGRKTFYLLAVLGKADPAEIQRCARHATAACAAKYMQDNGNVSLESKI